MKALVVVPYYHPYVGGLEIYARQLNIALHTLQGVDVVVVTSGEQRGVQTDEVDGLKIYRLGRWVKLSNTPFNPLWTRQIKRLLAAEKPDVILAHAPVPSMAAAASRAKGKTPFIVIYHAATLYKKGALLFNAAAWIYQVLGRRLMRRADRIFAVSQFVKDCLDPGLQAKTSVVPNAVWEREIVISPQASDNNFIFIGSLKSSHSWKGLSLILQAVARYVHTIGEDISLTVLGDGDMRQEYERQAEHLGIAGRVDFRGTVVGEAKDKAIKDARALLVYPTTANDAFPTVILEAWARHTPVIAAAIGPMPSLVNNGQDGILCPAEQPDKLARALEGVAKMSAATREKMADAAAERTRQNYTWEQQAKVVRDRIGELL
jgi:rhamnosyl/mannosyltransferase